MSGPESMLEPFGRTAQLAADQWWIMFGLSLVVYAAFLALLGLALVRARRRRRDGTVDPHGGADDSPVPRRLVLYAGVVGPAIVLLVLNVVTAPMTAAMGDRGASADGIGDTVGTDDLVIDVTGETFWWRVTYPAYDLITANEIHIPVGEPVRFRLTSADVIHSFWIPQLGGKIDMTPGHTTELVLEADEPGRYRGRCTEFCGLAHAQMVVHVVAQERADFDAWVERQTTPQSLDLPDHVERGRQVFFGSSCVYCHAVDGHGPPNAIGPDLTHLASRETIAAGILPNTRGHLAGWIVDPQAQKPGNLMPGTQIAGAELDALLDYLESLE